MTAARYVRAAAFTRRLQWAPTTVYKKLYNTRKKVRADIAAGREPGSTLTPLDLPIPDDEKDGVPRWSLSTYTEYVERYEAWERARSGQSPADAPTRPASPDA